MTRGPVGCVKRRRTGGRTPHEGKALAVYDLGTCPSDVVDAGPNTYLLTPTRLYVIKDRNRLTGLIDVYRQGRFFVGETGFGLIDVCGAVLLAERTLHASRFTPEPIERGDAVFKGIFKDASAQVGVVYLRQQLNLSRYQVQVLLFF